MSDEILQQRTAQQNKALWVYFTRLAEELNNAGLDMRVVLKPQYSIPWTKDSIHDYLQLPIQKAMYGTDSTTFLHKIEQVDRIHEVLNRELGEKFGVDYIPFPSDQELELLKLKYKK